MTPRDPWSDAWTNMAHTAAASRILENRRHRVRPRSMASPILEREIRKRRRAHLVLLLETLVFLFVIGAVAVFLPILAATPN